MNFSTFCLGQTVDRGGGTRIHRRDWRTSETFWPSVHHSDVRQAAVPSDAVVMSRNLYQAAPMSKFFHGTTPDSGDNRTL